MQLRFVGCGDAFGSGGRLNTCFHVSGRAANFLIDCGASALPALKRLEIDRNEIDLILITHFHGDHFAGLPFVLLDAQFSRRTRPLTIAGPQGIETRLARSDGGAVRALLEDQAALRAQRRRARARAKPNLRRGDGDALSGRARRDPAGPSWPTASRPRAARSPTAPIPNGRRRSFRWRMARTFSLPKPICTRRWSRTISA